jgi:glutathione S-transferase
MKLYDSVGPNPHVVRMFAAEKGLDIPKETIDLRGGENRREPYMSKVNPAGQCPALEMNNGQVLTEITAICEYLDEIGGGDSLIGTTPEERAETRMWTRRIDLNIIEPIGAGFRYGEGYEMFKDRIHCIPQAADDFKQIGREKLAWLDGLMDGKTYIVGERLTMADILLFCFLVFANRVGQPLNPDLKNIGAWMKRMEERPSAAA